MGKTRTIALRAPVDATPSWVLAKPIIIIGAPRSGTTFIADVMQQQPDVGYIDEPRLVWRYGNDGKSDMLTAADARQPVIRHIREDFERRVLAAGGKRMVEKTPSNALRMSFVDRVFPDARYIHVMRHGVDATLSILSHWVNHAQGPPAAGTRHIMRRLKQLQLSRLPYYAGEAMRRVLPKSSVRVVGQNLWGPRLPGMRQMLRDMGMLGVCAMQWRMCVEMAAQFGRALPAHRYLELRLEDLDHDAMVRTAEFCGLPAEVFLAAFDQKFKGDQPSARQKAADAQAVAEIRRWTEPTLRWFGYE